MAMRILVVEDDLLNRMFFHDVLEGHGYEVAVVSDGGAVMEEARAFRPDLVTMDIHLPNVSGLRLIRMMRRDAQLRDTPILAVTAFAGRGEEDRIRKAGADAYLSKPVTIERLLGEVEKLSRANTAA
ncbi:response regulator [Aurantiacibacter spongiae]|uniref:Response regulator n=1 Tax=Aurantiacibacter spongiae TaxID=2488860 RepID=A0A3N5CS53_9SPHN|nr:response regulator [Aurantiacibacter spongiae]RPF71417.1 response regulator [Aurantiacibacter spongiae]